MATKIKMLKLLQELDPRNDLSMRRPPPRPPGLYLIEIRSTLRSRPPSSKRVIPVKMQDPADIPCPVRIHFTTVLTSSDLRHLV